VLVPLQVLGTHRATTSRVVVSVIVTATSGRGAHPGSDHERRWWSAGPCSASAAMCSGAEYPLLSSQPYSGCSADRATIMASRVVLARMLAAATAAHRRSALIMVVTGGTSSRRSGG